jgi:hypothetical protein
MLFLCIAAGVPVLVYSLVSRLLNTGKQYRWLLVSACLTFFVSEFLPSPHIHGMQTEFTTHFIGGGVFSALLGLYILRVKRWVWAWYVEAVALFALVSSLGVLNELFEYALYYAGYMPKGIYDTSWDLVANTLGAACFFVGYRLSRIQWHV